MKIYKHEKSVGLTYFRSALGFIEYKSMGLVSILKIAGRPVYRRVGGAFSVMGVNFNGHL